MENGKCRRETVCVALCLRRLRQGLFNMTGQLPGQQHHLSSTQKAPDYHMPESRNKMEDLVKHYYYRMTNHHEFAARANICLKSSTVLSLTTPLLRYVCPIVGALISANSAEVQVEDRSVFRHVDSS